MPNLAARLDRALRAAGLAITGVSIGSDADRATWTCAPTALQPQAQATIDSFDPLAAAVADAETTAVADLTAAQKDLIATVALIASQTDVNWGSKTVGQKVTAVQGLLTTWKALRLFVEKNL